MKSLLLLAMAVLCAGAAAQGAQAPAKKAVPAAKSAAAATPAAARAATAKPAAGLKSALDKATLEAYLRHLFVWGRNVNVQISDPKPSELAGFLEVNVHAWRDDASQDEKFLISRDGRKIVRATVFDVDENPFRPELAKLKTQFQPSFGTPGAPVVLVLFTDFECPFCREEANMLRQNLLSAYPTQVRVYFQDYPLAQIHPWALAAALAGRCVFRQNAAAFWDYHDWVYEQQAQINAESFRSRLLEWAKGKPIDAVQLARCLDTRATQTEVERSVAQGQALQVRSTPTMFVNGRRLEGRTAWPPLRDIIDYEIDYQKTARNAGEDCGCEVKLP
ncbi:MAG: thioredoxin domain-containing protein [Bryobacteraceae bacterium]